ncbi:MAG: hypothetical protein ACKO3A_07515 [Opitutia bacterium]
MTLTQAYFALAALLLLAGSLVWTGAEVLRSFRRSGFATGLLGLAAVAWFVAWLWFLPEPDLAGLPRWFVLAVFTVASLATFKYLPDLLAIRALGVLMMFLARHVLDAGYTHLPHSLLAASVSYGLLVLFGLWWASSPPAFARQCDWVLAATWRRRVVGALLAGLGVACVDQAFRLT